MSNEVLSSGITKDTPSNIMFGAGTIHKDLSFENYIITEDTTKQSGKTYYTQHVSTVKPGETPEITFVEFNGPAFSTSTVYWEKELGWNFAESIIGATSGGTKLSIKPEFSDIDVDGATVKVKGLAVKTSETATLETNIIEVTPEIIKAMVVGKKSTMSVATDNYTEITSTQQISQGDYIKNLGYVGKTLDGRTVIVIFDNALCTSGLEIEGKNKESSVLKATFECYADLSNNPTTLPYHIYYPAGV